MNQIRNEKIMCKEKGSKEDSKIEEKSILAEELEFMRTTFEGKNERENCIRELDKNAG